MDLNQRIAARVRQLRAARDLSLEALADRSGVSRSMISLIERGETSATAVVLEKLAAALDITLAALFEPPAASAAPLVRKADQAVWRDPESGYLRRNVSPSGTAHADPDRRGGFSRRRPCRIRDGRAASRPLISRSGCWTARST